MYNTEHVKEHINGWIKELNSSKVNEIYSHVPFGKMVRAKLVLSIVKDKKEAIDLSAIIEMIHLASILHDDIIDNSTLRRGKKTINSLYDNNTATMLGDTIYSLAFNKLSNFEPKIIDIISFSVVNLSVGEIYDTINNNSFIDFDEKKYLDFIYKKTASLIEATVVSSAILAKLDIEFYKTYGKNIGIVFQIVDDLLDIVGDENNKPVFNDLLEGKITLPYMYLYNALDNSDRQRLQNYYKKKINEEDKNWIKQNFLKYKIADMVKDYVTKLVDDAVTNIDDEWLIKVAYSLIERRV